MICHLCPRRCGAERTETAGGGVCGMPAAPVVARAGLHHWEEPVISGTRGSGAVFFSGCNLRCVFCQNHSISAEGVGKRITTARLREIFEELIAQGAHNINLVTPTHFVPWILPALDRRCRCRSSTTAAGTNRSGTLRTLEGRVQIYLPDLKYAMEEPRGRSPPRPDYFPVAAAAIREMVCQTGPYVIENGLLRRGVVIRHLVLPGQPENTRRCIDWVSRTFRPGEVLFSLMSQYTPQPRRTGGAAPPRDAGRVPRGG